MSEPGCPICGAPLVAITINVGAGPRIMCSCARCDRRWWKVDDRLTDLDDVIGDLGEPVTHKARYRS